MERVYFELLFCYGCSGAPPPYNKRGWCVLSTSSGGRFVEKVSVASQDSRRSLPWRRQAMLASPLTGCNSQYCSSERKVGDLSGYELCLSGCITASRLKYTAPQVAIVFTLGLSLRQQGTNSARLADQLRCLLNKLVSWATARLNNFACQVLWGSKNLEQSISSDQRWAGA